MPHTISLRSIMVAVALATALTALTGCDAPPDRPPLATSSQEVRGDELAALVAALQGSVSAYDPALGALAWDQAVLDTRDERGDLVIVPIDQAGPGRALIALVEPGPRGPTFRSLIAETTVDPETGAGSAVTVRGLDGTARPSPEPGLCYFNCANRAWEACVAQFMDGGTPEQFHRCVHINFMICHHFCNWEWWYWWFLP